MKVIESSGATREEAIQRGLAELGVDLHDVDRIDVVDEGSKGFLGLGKRPVRVRLSVERAPAGNQRESNRRDPGPDRRPNRPQQQGNRPQRGENRPQEKNAPKEQPRQNIDKNGGQGEGVSPQEKRGSENRGEDNRNSNNRDRDRRGGDNRGGSGRGGDSRGGANRGGDNRGGTNRGGDNRGGTNRGGDNRGGTNRDGDKRGNENRGDARHDRGGDRDRNRNSRDNAQRHSGSQKPRTASGVPKAAPITGKSASNVSEEALEAHRLADQFDTAEENTAPEIALEALPTDVRENEVFESISDEQGKEAAALLNEIIAHMDLAGTVSFVRTKDGSARIVIESGEDGGILIGKRGVTLEAMQYLINRMIAQSGDNENAERVVVDVGDYVDRRHAMLRDMALSMAREARETRRNVRLKPLSPQERRIIHLTLENDPDVRTYSTGDSLFRSIIISPAGAKRGGNPRRGGAPHRENQNNGAPAQPND